MEVRFSFPHHGLHTQGLAEAQFVNWKYMYMRKLFSTKISLSFAGFCRLIKGIAIFHCVYKSRIISS